jgi:hypothetical protein
MRDDIQNMTGRPDRQNRTTRTELPKIGFRNLIWLRVLALESQDPPRGPLKHLKLIPDSDERHFGPPQLNCSPLVIFLWFFLTCSFLLHWLRKWKRFTFT